MNGAQSSSLMNQAAATGAMDDGFGWNFWGFFVLAAAWCIAYFVWAVWANRRDRG